MIIHMGYSTRFLYWQWWIILAVCLIDIVIPLVPILAVWLLLGLFIDPLGQWFLRFLSWEG